jgi:predicted double-glycine peptidase
MALGALGQEVEPGYLECLTAFAVSAQWEETANGRLPFFDAKCSAPDKGICQALRTLGYRFEHRMDDAEPLAELRRLLANGPVIVGPLDMGLLVYNPSHGYAAGSDHYVVVYAVEEDLVRLHDPAGYPHAVISHADFLAAWRADRIAYKMGTYSMWGNFQRETAPTADEMFRTTDRQIAAHLQAERERYGTDAVGAGMLRQLAQQAAGELSPDLRGHLAYFALPVSARRCEDFARFYQSYDGERSAVKSAQARLYGQAVSQLMARDCAGLSRTFSSLADLEERFQALTLQANAAP